MYRWDLYVRIAPKPKIWRFVKHVWLRTQKGRVRWFRTMRNALRVSERLNRKVARA